MTNWRNGTGKPLSSLSWLEAHHAAKLPERTAFVQEVVSRNPKRIVDLGCGPGIWLNLISQYVESSCELIGIDSDEETLRIAKNKATQWPQNKRFTCLDVDCEPNTLPEADIYLAFNIFPYVQNINGLFETIKNKLSANGALVIRQYDGSLLRLGPMGQRRRFLIDSSLQASVLGSTQFRHYDMDRVFEAINGSPFKNKNIAFETFQRVAPYPKEFLAYFENSVHWIRELLGEDAKEELTEWQQSVRMADVSSGSYCVETELVAWLS